MSYLMRIFFVATLFCVSSASVCGAAKTDLVMSVNAKSEYSDNIHFTEQNKRDDFITTISPGILWFQGTEISQKRISAQLDWIKYSEYDSLDDYNAAVNASYSRNLSPRSQIEAAAQYYHDTQTDRDLETTGLLTGNVDREVWAASLSGSYRHSEITSSRLGYSYSGENYTDGQYNEVQQHGLNYLYQHSLDERTTFRGQLNYDRQQYEDVEIDNLSATLGGQWRIDEVWDITADLGGRWTETRQDVIFVLTTAVPNVFDFVPGTLDEQEWGGVVDARLTRKTTHGSYSFSFVHDLLSASGQGNATERTGLRFGLQHRFDRHWVSRFSASHFRNRTMSDKGNVLTTGTVDKIDETSLSLSPAIRYEFDQRLNLEFSYHFGRIDDDVDQTTAEKNVFLLQLSWNHSFLEG